MAQELTVERFHLNHLDCAACAAKLEHGINQVQGVSEAVVDFANLTLHVKAVDMHRVRAAVQRIDPAVELISHSASTDRSLHQQDQAGLNWKKERALLGIAALLFFGLLFFEEWFHQGSLFYLEMIVALIAYLLVGRNVLQAAWRTLRNGTFFDENVLMVIATAGAMAIHAYAEAVGVMLFYKIGEMLQELAVSKSRRSIRALLAAKPNRAAVKTAHGINIVAPETVRVNDIIVVKPGEKIPLDGEILEGRSQIDSSALTGESVPISVRPGQGVMAGQITKTGALTIRVTRPFVASSIAKVMDLVENATARKAKTEKFITTFARYYTPAVVLIAAGIAFGPPLFTGAAFHIWIYRALVILVISCPCALVVSIPLGYFGGIGRASKEGILVKGSNFIDALAAVKTVVFDKTGTLTRGVFAVNEVVNCNGFSKDQLLEWAAAAEQQSNHPIAAAIAAAFERTGAKLDTAAICDHTDISGQGVVARYGPHTIHVGNDHLLHRRNIAHERCQFDNTVAHIVVDDQYVGYIAMGDQIRPEAHQAIAALRAQGVGHVAMLTGDNLCVAESVSLKLGLDSFHADLLPEDKVRIFETIEAKSGKGHCIAFVGDGINDAPVIARADVGIAMGGVGSDAAVETADVVLINDSPQKIAQAIAISKQTRRIVWQNIILAFGVKAIFITIGAMGMATMWEAVFADMGTALLAVANSTRILRFGFKI
jgi:Zn2+/Cd2+-exporting ATPase